MLLGSNLPVSHELAYFGESVKVTIVLYRTQSVNVTVILYRIESVNVTIIL